MVLTRRAVVGGAIAAALPPARVGAALPTDDIRVLREAYLAMHPGLYRYARPAQVAIRLDALDRAFQATDDLAARYLALTRFTASVRCGHTYPNFSNQKKAVAARLFEGRTRLPFHFRWLGMRMVVTRSPDLPRGTEVLAIDGTPARAILAALLPLARADGSNDAKRRALLDVQGTEDIETFDVLHPLLFQTGDRFDLQVRLPDGRRQQLRLGAIDLSERRAARSPGDPNKNWTLEHRGRTAVMAMDGWAQYNSQWDWRGWISEAFNDMARRGTTGLVVDLRRNEGGNDCGDEIIARLIDAPLPGRDVRRRVRFRTAPEPLWLYLDTWDQSFRTLGVGARDGGDGFFDLEPAPDNVIAPKGPRFTGRMLVLTSAQNSSSTFQFAARVREARLGTLVGGTTGGNQRGINGGCYFFVRLPGGLEVDLPLVGYFPARRAPDAGIDPDIAVHDSLADMVRGRDAALDRALALLA